MITKEEIKKHAHVECLLFKADEFLDEIGYTEHGLRHANLVSSISTNILKKLDYSEREIRLAGIAGYLHDIGNAVNREDHAQTGAVLAYSILQDIGVKYTDIVDIIAAIGNHHEETSNPVSNIVSACILADKTDVHRSRVRNRDALKFDIHDRVNYAVTHSFLEVDKNHKTITLNLTIDEKISNVMEYFEIFIERMAVCRRAAKFLGCTFHILANGTRIL